MVRPLSMMSSTMITSRPSMDIERSEINRTTPEERVPALYEDTLMKSRVTARGIARIRSATKITAPLRTPTRIGARLA